MRIPSSPSFFPTNELPQWEDLDASSTPEPQASGAAVRPVTALDTSHAPGLTFPPGGVRAPSAAFQEPRPSSLPDGESSRVETEARMHDALSLAREHRVGIQRAAKTLKKADLTVTRLKRQALALKPVLTSSKLQEFATSASEDVPPVLIHQPN